MNLRASYFSIANPLDIIDRWFNPYRFNVSTKLRGKNVDVFWTQRAEHALSNRTSSLLVEMQLYFSCVIKKRVLFHDDSTMESQPLNEKIRITSRAVQSGSCSAEEFAKRFPIKQELTSKSAKNMLPTLLKIDYKNNQWIGEFSI